MAEIKCPMCGKPNPEELDVCQFCEARLKPLTDELSRSQPPIHPGDEPTEIDTGQLEPVLPQWLREVRKQARDTSEPEEEPEQSPAEAEAAPVEESPDLLAGLQSQAESDEEIPEWLTSLRGESTQFVPEEAPTEEDDMSALKRMLGEEATEEVESEASELPGWISDLGGEEPEKRVEVGELSDSLADGTTDEESVQAEAQPAASESDFDRGADYEPESDLQAESTEEAAPIDTKLPDWLKGAEEEAGAGPEGGTPDWMETEEPAQAVPPMESEGMAETASEEAQPADGGDMPAWLASLGQETAEEAPQEAAEPVSTGDMPDWLSSLGEETAESAAEEEAQPASEGDTQDRLASLSEETAESAAEETAQPIPEGDTPDWLYALGTGGLEAPPRQETEESLAEGETPDWLASMGEEAPQVEEISDELAFPAPGSEGQAEEAMPSAISAGEEAPPPAEDLDALFSMDMPEWLSDAAGTREAEEETAAAPTEEETEDLRPAELPSWVQAMRPVEAVIPESEGGATPDQPVEQEGPLAGLKGVLPAVPGVGPTSKPGTFSIKLQASEEQQSSAAMLEQMLAAEVNPKPITTQPVMLSQRFLRWIIAAVLLTVVIGSVFSGMQLNPLPAGAPPETSAALRYIQEGLPEGAPVLLIFDYDAALAGELEASAAPLVDHMLTLKHPRLGLIASTPAGAGLAERFLADTQSDHNYQVGQQFVNLGYLPGGAAGVLAFAENPVMIKPTSVTGDNAWTTPALQGVGGISDFASVILLTSDVESARIWIEQTEPLRGASHFLVISSAQSGPMILPYVQSGQVDGIVTGLDGSAPIERVNNGRPGMVRSYWDAYGFGLLAALVMISLGSLWSLLAGLRERSREQGEA